MRFLRPHAGFVLMFIASLASFIAAFFVAIAAIDGCGQTSSPACQSEVAGARNLAIVIALGGLTTMIGGVGFQVGRGSGPAAMLPPPGYGAPVHQQPPPPIPGPGAPSPGYPGQWPPGSG
ncbi:hypothetical protein SAMN05421869_124116 [Nonomuraea jiangxiensis]|uniref:Uncharacterized protein n=1 Tax=Nonomuraea jiangxiensis TaxID=633440 RepID=A0A1G9J1Y1_9ACTN|nr:hypothetical protein SAMN05421869_124116 [Nonomuraea jiangxiensis]